MTATQFDADAYYSRQAILWELGKRGQQKLRDAKVTIVGVGGLGSVSALYLTLAGVGRLTLIDQDTVEITNLHRQALYSFSDLRHAKVEVAVQRLSELNPGTSLEGIAENLNQENIEALLADSQCVVDGLDNMATRYMINRYCVKHQVPYVFGGAIGLEGNVAVFRSPETPCLECVLPDLDDTKLPTCDTRGVIGATTGIIGSLQALEAVKVLAVNMKPQSKLMIFDFAQSEFRTIDLQIRLDCSVCQVKTTPSTTGIRKLAWLCGSNTVNVNPDQPTSVDLEKANQTLKNKHSILVATPVVLVFDYNGHEVSLFKRGRMLIKNVNTEQEAEELYKEIITTIRS